MSESIHLGHRLDLVILADVRREMAQAAALTPYTANREAYADQLMLAAVNAFYESGVRVTTGQRSPDYVVARMRQAVITYGYTTHELNQAVLRLRRAGKLVDVPVGKYECHHPRLGLMPVEIRAEFNGEVTELCQFAFYV